MNNLVRIVTGMLTTILITSVMLNNANATELSSYEKCQLAQLKNNAGSITSAEINSICKREDSIQAENDPLVLQAAIMRKNHFFTLLAHKPNYMMPLSYSISGRNTAPYDQQFQGQGLSFDQAESQFQISIKVKLFSKVIYRQLSLMAGYTNRSFWQVYNKDISSPFRETNHEPELWLQQINGAKIFQFTNIANLFGIVHQSNGRGGTLSRSWNRIFANFVFEKNNVIFSIKPWLRITEKAEEDDNPNITDYLGHGEIRLAYSANDNDFSVMSRNNLESGFSRGSFEFTWAYPLGDRKDIKGFLMLFSGYGESLIDYNYNVNTIGFGITISNWI